MNHRLACLALILVVAGCGGEAPTSRTPPSQAVHTSPTDAQTPSAEQVPALPPAAREESPAGARAFATYFIELHNHALRTGETADLRRVLAPECFMCLTIPALVEAAYGGGGRIVGGLWVPTSPVGAVPSSQGEPKGMAFLQLSMHLVPMKTITSSGRVASTLDGSTHDRGLLIWTSWRNGQWYVDQINGVGGQML